MKTELWAKDVLEESNINIDKPYTIYEGDNWMTYHKSISVKKNFREDDEYLNKFKLKHEVKHLKNNDLIKSSVLFGCTTYITGLATFILRKKPLFSIPVMLVGYAMNMAYWKYSESEADRFACLHATSIKELEAVKKHWLDKRSNIIDAVDVADAIEHSEHKLQTKNLSYYDRLKERNRLKLLKYTLNNPDIIVDIIEFTHDREHPLSKNRAAMVQQYIDKWDETHL